MSSQSPAAEALAAYRAYLQAAESVPQELRRSIEEQVGPIEQIVAGTREIAARVEGDSGTVRFVRQIAFRGSRSIVVSEDTIRAEIQRTPSGWRITKAAIDQEAVPSDTAGIQEVDETLFNKTVLEAPLPVLVHFGADWSAPCRDLSRTLTVVAAERSGMVDVRRVNISRNGALAARYGVQGIPALVLFESGRTRAQMVGNVPKEDIDSFLRSNGIADR